MQSNNKWIVLFGGAGREASVESMMNAGINVEVIVVPARRDSFLEQAVARLSHLPCQLLEVDKAGLAEALKPWAGNALLSIGFPYLITAELLALFKPALNMHPTLLPRYRGPTTAAYILLNDECESGSTIHHMTPEMDRGDIVSQTRVSLTSFDSIRSLKRKVYNTEPQLVLDAIEALKNGAPVQPQSESESSEFPKKRTPADSEIDPSIPLTDLFNHIRASDPDDFPAFFYHKGEKVCIYMWRPEKDAEAEDEI
jgi:methionyl-tRNA formyltransferase